jgi:hypothetical protein
MTPAEEHLSIEELHRLFRYEDGKLYNRLTRNSRAVIGAEVGCDDSHGYLDVRINKRKYKVHRIIWAVHNGRWPEGNLQIDHEGQNNQNNNIENLREVTSQENQWNNSAKGYSFTDGKYRAHIQVTVNGIRQNFRGKRRDTEEEAIQDRKDLILKYHKLGL